MTKTKKDDFVHLHTHSDMSQLDGCATIDAYTKAAKKRGNPAIAITDHGTMRGYHALHEATEKHGVNPIYGIEFYVAKKMRRKGLTDEEKQVIGDGMKKAEAKIAVREFEEQEGIRDRWHLTVWAKDDQGLKNLFYLSSKAYTDGFYYKPRIDIDALIKHGDGLMVGSGCLSSIVNNRVVSGKKKAAIKVSDQLFDRFGSDYWLEIQPHPIDEQEIANKYCMNLSKRYGGKVGLLATQDAHYVRHKDAIHHDVMLCIGTHRYLSDQKRFRFDGDGFFLKRRDQMRRSFEDCHPLLTKQQIKEALDNTMAFAERVTAKVEIDYLKGILPDVELGEGFDNDWSYFKSLCFQGWIWRAMDKKIKLVAKMRDEKKSRIAKEYKTRLAYEMNTIKKQNFIPYFLVVYDIYRWVRENKIMCGPGRGSAAGSLVSYLLGITSVDPIEHKLSFERFMNPDRIDLPDIDMDFEDSRRHEIINYLRDKYGHDRVAQIATIGTLKGKQCVRDVSRVLGVPIVAVNEVASSIIERSSAHPRTHKTVVDSFKEFEVCQRFDRKYPSVVQHASKLEGMAKSLGIHAAGVVVAPKPIWHYTPVELRKYNDKKNNVVRNITVTALDKNAVSAIGLVKLDILGLKTLTVLRLCLEAIKERHGKTIDLERVDLYDQAVLDRFTARDFSGIFQFDTPSADKMCEGIVFDRFADLPALNALNRPGATRSGLAKEWITKKKNPKKRKKSKFHKSVVKIASDTLGVITYQEHVIYIFSEVAGFDKGEADKLRKKIGGSKGKEAIDEIRDEFIKGAVKKHGKDGMTVEAAEKIINAIGHFGAYGFNKCLSGDSFVLRAGSNSICSSPWISIKELYNNYNKRDGNKLSPIAKKMRYSGLSIIQMDEDYQCRPGKMIGVHRVGKRRVYVAELEDGTITAEFTKKHRWLTMNGCKSLNTGLCVGDYLFVMLDYQGYKKKGFDRRCSGSSYSCSGSSYKNNDGCGVPCGEENPGWVDGRHSALEEAKKSVLARSKQCCENCGVAENSRFEFAHINSVDFFDGDFLKYNSENNLMFLCNTCHKKLDYKKGERKKRWVKGRETEVLKIVSIRPVGKKQCYDIEMQTEMHNFVVSNDPDRYCGVVTHNSHATSYAIIAYWAMYLKTYYALEFYWALLKNEEDANKVQKIAKDAKRRGIKILPPDISVSRKNFAIDPNEENTIRGSLADIKGVGEKAISTIVENQPFKSFWDFVERTNRRQCHKGVTKALVKSGAMDLYIPNIKWLLDNFDSFWGNLTKHHVKKALKKSRKKPDYDREERNLLASTVNPFSFGEHPIIAYRRFLKEHIKVKVSPLGGDFYDKFNNKHPFILGIIVDSKFARIGDYHTGDLPNKQDRKRQFWGHRYANANIEGRDGDQRRVKFDIDIFEQARSVLDSGSGTPVLVHCGNVNAAYSSVKANFILDLESLRKKVKTGEELSMVERLVTGDHPALSYPWKSKKIKNEMTTHEKFKKSNGGGIFCGVITHIRIKYDRNDNQMAFIGVFGVKKHIEVVCFSSNWLQDRKKIIEGSNRLVKIAIEKQRQRGRGLSYFYNGGGVKVLNNET